MSAWVHSYKNVSKPNRDHFWTISYSAITLAYRPVTLTQVLSVFQDEGIPFVFQTS